MNRISMDAPATLRDEFAAAIIAGLVSGDREFNQYDESSLEHVASAAYALANAMLKEREKWK